MQHGVLAKYVFCLDYSKLIYLCYILFCGASDGVNKKMTQNQRGEENMGVKKTGGRWRRLNELSFNNAGFTLCGIGCGKQKTNRKLKGVENVGCGGDGANPHFIVVIFMLVFLLC